MKIPVVYKSGKEDLIEPKFLDILLYLGEVQEFRRSDHWVNVAEDPIRTPHKQQEIPPEKERRHHTSAKLDFSLQSLQITIQ